MGESIKGVKGVLSVAGLLLRLFLFLIPIGFLGWAGFRKVHPLVKGLKRKRKPTAGRKEKQRTSKKIRPMEGRSMKEVFKSPGQP